MAMWLYQLNPDATTPERYRLEIWENERWNWPVGKIAGDERPKQGDTVVFFYSGKGKATGGFYGWAVVLDWREAKEPLHDPQLSFRPVAPSDRMKMRPWGDDEAQQIANAVRVPVQMLTLYPVSEEEEADLRARFVFWPGVPANQPVSG